jgi:hypothetical protein
VAEYVKFPGRDIMTKEHRDLNWSACVETGYRCAHCLDLAVVGRWDLYELEHIVPMRAQAATTGRTRRRST